MYKKIKILILLLIFSLAIPFSYSIGVGLYTEEIDFTPNLNANFEGLISNNVGKDVRVELRANGDLAEYVTFSPEFLDIPKGQISSFTFNIKLPEKIKPGLNKIYIGGEDVTPSPGEAGISAKTAAFIPFKIRMPYPGKYIEAGLNVNDIEENGIAEFSINLISRGEKRIDKIDGIIDIFDQDSKIFTLTLDPLTNIQPQESRTMKANWDSKGHKIGEYNAKATINYDTEQLTLDATFRIGALLVGIINYTKEFYQNEINQFDIEIESFWNINIDNIYGEIEIDNEKLETLKTSLSPWGKTIISAYWDTSNVELGEYTANIKVYYADKVAKEIANITVLPEREKIVELPYKISSTTIILISTIILLLIVNIIVILYFIRHKTNKKIGKK